MSFRSAVISIVLFLLAVTSALAFIAEPANAQSWPVDSTGAYAWPISVAPGDTVNIYVSARSTYTLSFRREGITNVEVAQYPNQPASIQPLPDSAWANGCNWSPSFRLRIPDTWKSGVYSARCFQPDTTFEAMFVVREKNPGSTSRILFEIPVTTWAAYNRWGGHSMYRWNSNNNVSTTWVSLKRPYFQAQGRGYFPTWEWYLVSFLESRGYTIEYCMGPDLQWLPDLERHYDLVIGAGHDEYWSLEMRNTMEARIARGGNVAFFTGNLCWWQVRLQDDGRMVCYKSKATDPLTGIDNSRVTVNWYDDPVFRPENTMTGCSTRNAGAPNGYGGYFAYHTDHWVLAGTGLQDSSYFGQSTPIVNYEVEGALYQWVNGEPEVTGAQGTPLSYVILGMSPATQGTATMGIFSGPGLVFNAGTTDWVKGLAADTTVQHITRNVVDGMLVRVLDAPGPSATSVSSAISVSVSPNPSRGSVWIEWRVPPGSGAPRVWICDLSGRVVARPRFEAHAGDGHVQWDGNDRTGRREPPGVYFAKVECGQETSAHRFLMLK